MNNNDIAPVDFTEASLLEMIERMKGSFTNYVVRPTRYIVPPWVVEEIEAQYGAPATEEKYHRWNNKRLGLPEVAPPAE